MHTVRQLFDHAPALIPVPEQWRQKRMEVIFLIQEEEPSVLINPSMGLKQILANMPNVGENLDFVRSSDTGRQDIVWNS